MSWDSMDWFHWFPVVGFSRLNQSIEDTNGDVVYIYMRMEYTMHYNH